MKNLVLFLMLTGAAFAQNSQFGGLYRAMAYAYGAQGGPQALQVSTGTTATGAGSIRLTYGRITLNDGTPYMPFATNAPIQVGSEIVTPSSVSCSTVTVVDSCTISATFSQMHYRGENVSSATVGLQEALNAADAKGGGAAVADGAWAAAGGTSAMISAAVTTAVAVVYDNRKGSSGISSAAPQFVNRVSTGLNLVFDGDSITAGFGLSAGQDYPSQSMSLSSFLGRGTKTNVAVSGQTAAQVLAGYVANVHPLSPAVTGHAGYYFVWAGTNDIKAGTTAATTYSTLQSIWSGAKADGFKVIAFTTIPRGDQEPGNAAYTLQRQLLNQMIRSTATSSSAGFDYLVDAESLLPYQWDLTIFQADHIHPNAVGAQRIASYLNGIFWNDGQIAASRASTPVIGSGTGNTGTSNQSLFNLTTGANNSSYGFQSLQNETTGNQNSSFGASSATSLTTGSQNACFGASSCTSITTQGNNAAFGYGAQYQATGSNNVAMGWLALSNTPLGDSVALGYKAAQNYQGQTSVFIGSNSGVNSNTASLANNVAVGFNTMPSVAASQNTAVGSGAAASLTSATNLTAFGYQAGTSVTTGAGNTFVGAAAGGATTGTNNEGMGINAKVGAANTGAAQIGSGTNNLDNSMQFQAVIVTRVAGTFSTLPACVAGIEGSTAPVTDSTTATYAATVTGGGANHIKAYCNGTNWVVD